MSYIDKVLHNYLKSFKVTKHFEFITNNGNEFKVNTYKYLNIYYVKFSRVSRDGTKTTFYQENYADTKDCFKQVVCSVIIYLNQHA